MGVPGGSGGFRRVPGVKVPGEGVPWCSGVFREAPGRFRWVPDFTDTQNSLRFCEN